MRITVNGEPRDFAGRTVAELLDEIGIDPRRVAVELNLQVLRKAEFATMLLREGDSVEIVNFVGGGRPENGFRR